MKKFWSVLLVICTILICSTFAISANTASAASTKSQSVCTIVTQPKTTYAKNGAAVKVSVKASGKGLKYQWYIKDSGAKKYTKSSITSSTYSVKMSSKVNNRYVYCVVKNQYGKTVKTKTVQLRMKATITTQPKTTYAQNGATAKVTVKAVGNGLKYQWYIKNAGETKYSKSSNTSSTYSVKMSSTANNRYVYCVIKDKYGNSVKTNAVQLRMKATITTQPKTISVKNGATAKITVKAVGNGLKYQWYVKNAGATKYSKSSNTTATYSVKMSNSTINRSLYCVVTDKYGNSVKTNTVKFLHAHTEVVDKAIAATCTKTGLTAGKHCSVCGKTTTKQTTIAKLGHKEAVDKAVEPTCTETGLTEGSHCSRCNGTLVEQTTVAALNHIEVIDKAVAATCTTDGKTEGKHCSRCNTTLVAQTTVAALGHVEVIDKAVAAICTTDGKTAGKHCSRCNTALVAQTTVAALGHVEVIDSAVAATCTTDGKTEGKHCSRCNTTLVAQTTVGALGHVEVIDSAVAATCTEDGKTEGKHCSRCNTTLVAQTTVDALGHNYQDGVCIVCQEKKVSVGLKFTLNSDGKSYRLTGIGTCTDSDIVIPSYYNGKPITSIGSYAFSRCTSLISISMPDSITSIGSNAFYNCTSLTSVMVSDNIVCVEKDAFYNCYALCYNEYDNAYYLGNENNPYLVLKSAQSLYITSCNVHESTKVIADSAFLSCRSLASINISDTLTHIGTDVFKLCKSLTTISVSANNKYYKSIDGNLYNKDGTTLIQYAIGKSDASFNIPNTVTCIGESAFYACETLKNINIHNGIISIEDMAFDMCTFLESVTIGDGVTSIGDYAFKLCLSLKTITIGDAVMYMGDAVFNDCKSLTAISVSANNKYYKSVDGNLYSKDGKTLLQYSVGKTNTSFMIPTGVETISDWAFYNCEAIVDVTISESVTSIGKWCFASCDLLSSIDIPDNVLIIGDSAFQGCKSLTRANIGNGITTISSSAFSSCTTLTSVSISNSVTSIGEAAFNNCTALSNIVIPNSVTSIGDDAFYCCTALSSISISNSVTSIGGYAFYACSSLTTIRFNATKADWEKISKERNWDYCTAEYKVYCTNGTITKTA